MKKSQQKSIPLLRSLYTKKGLFKCPKTPKNENSQSSSYNLLNEKQYCKIGFNSTISSPKFKKQMIKKPILSQNQMTQSVSNGSMMNKFGQSPVYHSTVSIAYRYEKELNFKNCQKASFIGSIKSLKKSDSTDSSVENQCSSSAVQERKSKYLTLKCLGKGRFGKVYLSMHRETGFVGALKVIQKSEIMKNDLQYRERTIQQLISQIKLQGYLRHPNLIRLYDFFHDDWNIYMFMQLGTDGHLLNLLDKKEKFEEETVSILTRQIVSGVQYMHEKMVIHRDIKLENIVLTFGMVKICDFGWATYEPKNLRSTICGTPLYLPPEILKGKKYNSKIDIWAIGTLTHEIAVGDSPFGIKKRQDLSKIVTQDFQMTKGSPQLKSFISFILRKDPEKRPDAQILLRHPFITKYKNIQTSEEICQLISS